MIYILSARCFLQLVPLFKIHYMCDYVLWMHVDICNTDQSYVAYLTVKWKYNVYVLGRTFLVHAIEGNGQCVVSIVHMVVNQNLWCHNAPFYSLCLLGISIFMTSLPFGRHL